MLAACTINQTTRRREFCGFCNGRGKKFAEGSRILVAVKQETVVLDKRCRGWRITFFEIFLELPAKFAYGTLESQKSNVLEDKPSQRDGEIQTLSHKV